MCEQVKKMATNKGKIGSLVRDIAGIRLAVFVWAVVLGLVGNVLSADAALPCILANSRTGAKKVKPIQLHPDNPHYFLWRGKPTVLITSGEHYGAVLNRAFNYKKYLKTLESYGFNLTRTFSGAYCEPLGAFKIQNNTLAPAKGQLICPWARSNTPGYANGGNKLDLTNWDRAYFKRLRDFVAEAGKCGVVVELVLFCPFYKDDMWKLSPMNAANNVNGIGKMERTKVYTLNHPKLLAVQDAMVRKIVEELRDFDNVYYEICNEPYFGGVTLEWQAHIAKTIVKAEANFNQLYAAYARGKEAQELATIMGEAALSEEDKKYMTFADKFEAEYVSQDYYENREIETTLDLGWELLSMFDNVELKRIDIKLIEKYMPKFRKNKKED